MLKLKIQFIYIIILPGHFNEMILKKNNNMRFKIVLFLSGLILISGCVDKETVISPGVYKISIKATRVEKELMPIQIFREFKVDGSYNSIWKANVFGLMEEKGDWEVQGDFIRFPNTSVRQIDESGALGAWEPDPKYNILKYKIRNIMENSFEIYIEPWDNECQRKSARQVIIVACFQYKQEAELFHRRLGEQLNDFHLQLAEEKTSCIEFGRFARGNARARGEKPGEFTFLGYTFYCGKTKKGRFKVKRRTSRKKLNQSLIKFTLWVRKARKTLRKGELLRRAKVRVVGHINYFAITDNSEKCGAFLYFATRILFKWINRKSQRRSYTWEGFNQVLKWVKWPTVKIRVNMNPFERSA